MGVTVEVKGVGEIVAKINALRKALPQAVADALYAEGMELQAEAQRRTPVDTGRLRASAYTAPPETRHGEVAVEVGYGVDYALAVHERIEVPHKVGEAKFLENALLERANGYLERIAQRAGAIIQGRDERGRFTRGGGG